MPRYLLGSQCLVDIARRVQSPAEQWFATAGERGIDASDVYISAVTPMILRSTFKAAAPSPTVTAIRENSENLVNRFARSRQLAPVTQEIADRWGQLLDFDLSRETADGETKLYRFQEKLVLATAIEGLDGRPFVLVDKRQSAHDKLAPLGLDLEDPYELA
ncbi:MAG: hypothetical protein QF578_06580 [Alphaproteobacteria bacterium]|jgi:predicted nucleic acid-binding protein|nr:hypothetical protein [Alphaproteobacteria bacterium]MDP6564475.1 hypothetical protein [Alphaproteobacteria bacterium]MDP6814700.1 hypothetical protein [Alphaproteobacteria bacterium]